MKETHQKVALILGSGSARGMSHIGIIKALEKIGVIPDIVVGCSVGALVGAAYLNNKLDLLEDWVLSLDKMSILKYLGVDLSLTGFIDDTRMQDFFENHICNAEFKISNLSKPFATTATDISTGEEIWLRDGSLLDAVRASMAFPGLYPAHLLDNRLLVDGGLVNPIPVSLAKALGADVTIAVNLNSGLVKKNDYSSALNDKKISPKDNNENDAELTLFDSAKNKIKSFTNNWLTTDDGQEILPKSFEVISSSVNIMQDRLTRSRLAGDPPDITLSPRLANIGLLELYKAKEAIDEGFQSVMRVEKEIKFRVNS